MTLRIAKTALYALALVSYVASAATPGDLQTVQVTRSAESGPELQTTLFKNVFRQEAYQDSYTERVPYEDTETYYEDVPYTVQVPYTDYEEYYENEYVCRDVIDYRRECTTERVCERPAASFFLSLLIPQAKAQSGTDDKAPRRPFPGGGGDNDGGGRPEPARPQPPSRPEPPPRPEPPRPQPPPRPEPPRPQPPPRPEPPRPQPPPRPEPPRPQPPPRPEPPRPQPPPRPEPPRPQPPPRPEPPRPQPPPRPEPPRPPRPEPPQPPPPRPEPPRPPRPEPPQPPPPRPEPPRPPRPEPPQPPPPRPEPPRPPRPEPPPPPRPPRPPVCRDVERCRNVPYTRQECGFEPVRRTRPVTRYREEIRYRREERTRTVIRYRDETRCCVTRYRDVFDHQWTLPVTLRFPADAVLNAGEQETFRVDLTGDEAQPDVNVTPVNTIFGYAIKLKDVKPGSALVELATAPKFTAEQVGATTIKGLQLSLQGNGQGEVRFEDTVRAPRLSSHYKVQIFDGKTGAVLAQLEQAAPLAGAVAIPIGTPLPVATDLRIQLDVARQGVVLEGGQTAFSVTANFSGVLDIAVQRDNSKIGGLDVVGSKADAALVFFDKAPAHPDVKTVYTISTSYKNAAGKAVYVQEKTLDRANVLTQADGTYKLSFKELGVTDANLAARFGAGQQVTLSVEVFRTSSKFSKISLWQGKTVTIR